MVHGEKKLQFTEKAQAVYDKSRREGNLEDFSYYRAVRSQGEKDAFKGAMVCLSLVKKEYEKWVAKVEHESYLDDTLGDSMTTAVFEKDKRILDRTMEILEAKGVLPKMNL
jgi:hypothetical protein